MYAILRHKGCEDFVKIGKVIEEAPNLVNFYYVMKEPAFDVLFEHAGEIEPANYPSIFTEDNNKLFESLKNYSFMGAIDLTLDTLEDTLKEALSELS